MNGGIVNYQLLVDEFFYVMCHGIIQRNSTHEENGTPKLFPTNDCVHDVLSQSITEAVANLSARVAFLLGVDEICFRKDGAARCNLRAHASIL